MLPILSAILNALNMITLVLFLVEMMRQIPVKKLTKKHIVTRLVIEAALILVNILLAIVNILQGQAFWPQIGIIIIWAFNIWIAVYFYNKSLKFKENSEDVMKDLYETYCKPEEDNSSNNNSIS